MFVVFACFISTNKGCSAKNFATPSRVESQTTLRGPLRARQDQSCSVNTKNPITRTSAYFAKGYSLSQIVTMPMYGTAARAQPRISSRSSHYEQQGNDAAKE